MIQVRIMRLSFVLATSGAMNKLSHLPCVSCRLVQWQAQSILSNIEGFKGIGGFALLPVKPYCHSKHKRAAKE